MVLSNKKLKQTLRTVISSTTTAAAAEPDVQPDTPEQEKPPSLRSLLLAATHKPKVCQYMKRKLKIESLKEKGEEVFLNKRKSKKKRKRRGKDGDGEMKADSDTDRKGESGDGSDTDSDDSISNKRKRGSVDGEVKENEKESEGGGLKKKRKVEGENGNLDGKDLKKKKKKKKKKKVKKKKNKGVKEEEEKGVENANMGGKNEEQVKMEVVETLISIEDNSTKVYVGGIPYYSTEDDIMSYFDCCGTITEVDCLKFPETGKFNGIAMISFKTEAAAKRALALDGSDMGGLILKIQPYKGTRDKRASDFAPPVVEGYNRIYAGNLSWDVTEDELKNFFSDCSISSIRLGKDKETGDFKGYAHVDFADSHSLTMALKLDGKIVCGRPVRIRCAVPSKGLNTSAKALPSSKTDNGFKLVSFSKKVEDATSDPTSIKEDDGAIGSVSGKISLPTTNKETDDNVNDSVSGKIRRRTCYECGEKGHMSSSCPKMQAAESNNFNKNAAELESGPTSSVLGDYKSVPLTYKSVSLTSNEVGDNVVNPTSGKIKRRTCYECGDKGHLSSSCPKKQAIDSIPPSRNANQLESLPASNEFDGFAPVPNTSNEVASDLANSTSGKIRRRTCYECGEKGHLSSACPKKQAIDSIPPSTNANQLKSLPASHEVDGFTPVPDTSNEVGSNVANSSSGKIRRRTCYECGEKGHLSSACPKKLAADGIDFSAT